MSSCLHCIEDEPINENKESDKKKQEKKQKKQKKKKKQTKASDADADEDTLMQSPDMCKILWLLLILLINFIEIPALGSSYSVGGIIHSQSHGNSPNIGDFEKPSNNEDLEKDQVFVYHLLDRPLPDLLFRTHISFMLDEILVGATFSQILQILIETRNIYVQGKFQWILL